MNQEELDAVLENHRLWLLGSSKGVKANLSGANLSGAYLINANLRNANLSGANLSGAYLSGANISDTNLSDANLSDANLSYANLSDTNLRRVNLSYTNLSYANLSYANLRGAYLSNADLPHFQICPEEGSFVGYKKCSGEVILKVLIPSGAKRTSSLVGRKCRASSMFVTAWRTVGSSLWYTTPCTVASKRSSGFLYTMGEVSSVADFNNDIREECVAGLHFFMTLREAEEYK